MSICDRATAGRGHFVELGERGRGELAVRRGVLPRGAEEDALVVGREARRQFVRRVEGEALRLAAVGVDDVDVVVAVAVRREGDLLAVVAPDRA